MSCDELDTEIERVVAGGNCSGCGMCTLLDRGITMRLSDEGFMRPVRMNPTAHESTKSQWLAFRQACPGVRVTAQRPPGSVWHGTMGPVISVYQAWATDDAIRYRASSGGALTAIATYLLGVGQSSTMVGATSDEQHAETTVSVQITSAAEALSLAGSRYGPVSNAAQASSLNSNDVFVGKPCEVAALRALSASDPSRGVPILMSFFCAGTPSQLATNRLIASLGMPVGDSITEMWYRGRGWPGHFTAIGESGSRVSAGYETSWGEHLGRDLQWRCRICADGVGESADLAAADYWETDADGRPMFSESQGISAVVVRTSRGRDVFLSAVAAGVIDVREIGPDALAARQPLHASRRASVPARLLAQRLAGGTAPKYSGFRLIRRIRLRAFLQTLRRSYGQYRHLRGLGV